MIALSAPQYPILGDLFSPLHHHLVIDSVLEGNTPARVFADRLNDPTAGLIWDRQDAILVAGRLADDLTEIIQNEIVPDARRRWIPALTIYYADEGWVGPLMERMAAFKPELTGMRFYHFDRLRVNWREILPEGYGMRRIDPELLNKADLLNAADVAGWVRSFWASDEDFVQKGFGYCAMMEDSIASWCLTVFVARDQRELGVATARDQQGKGLATAVAAAALEHCLGNGFQPYWHCLDENIPSWRIAERLGFCDPVHYDVIRLHL